MLNSTLLLFKNIISIKKNLQLSDLTTFKNSRVEIHQILALVFYKKNWRHQKVILRLTDL